MSVCEILVMLNSVSGPKPVCLQQVTVHIDLETLKPIIKNNREGGGGGGGRDFKQT